MFSTLVDPCIPRAGKHRKYAVQQLDPPLAINHYRVNDLCPLKPGWLGACYCTSFLTSILLSAYITRQCASAYSATVIPRSLARLDLIQPVTLPIRQPFYFIHRYDLVKLSQVNRVHPFQKQKLSAYSVLRISSVTLPCFKALANVPVQTKPNRNHNAAKEVLRLDYQTPTQQVAR